MFLLRETESANLSFVGFHPNSVLSHIPYLPFNVLQEVLMALEEIQVLEFRVITLRLDKSPLLNIHHFPKTI